MTAIGVPEWAHVSKGRRHAHRNTPAATDLNTSGKANPTRSQRTLSQVSDSLNQLRTPINGRPMWDLEAVRPYISDVSHSTYIEHVLSVLDHLDNEELHSYTEGVDARYFFDSEVFELVSQALDAPREVQDYFSAPSNVVSLRSRLNRHTLPAEVVDDRSPFDRIRQVREDGTEIWSARDLMPLLGYDHRNAWQSFRSAVIDRAISAARNQGADLALHFTDVREKSGGRPRENVELTRFAAYLVAMNGDPNKPEVAAAQAYFAIMTREAETRPAAQPQFEIPQSLPEALRLAADLSEQNLELESAVQELTPKAESYDEFLNADGYFEMGTAARILGIGRNVLFRELRNKEVLFPSGPMRNTPYQHYMRHFEVFPRTYEKPNGEVGTSHKTYVQPSGLDFIRRKLDLA